MAFWHLLCHAVCLSEHLVARANFLPHCLAQPAWRVLDLGRDGTLIPGGSNDGRTAQGVHRVCPFLRERPSFRSAASRAHPTSLSPSCPLTLLVHHAGSRDLRPPCSRGLRARGGCDRGQSAWKCCPQPAPAAARLPPKSRTWETEPQRRTGPRFSWDLV